VAFLMRLAKFLVLEIFSNNLSFSALKSFTNCSTPSDVLPFASDDESGVGRSSQLRASLVSAGLAVASVTPVAEIAEMASGCS